MKNSINFVLRRRATRLALLLLVAIVPLIVVASGTGSQDGIGAVIGGRGFNLVSWEFDNFLDKWLHEASSLLPWNGRSEAEEIALVQEYFHLNREISSLEPKISRASSEEARQTLSILREVLERRRDSIGDDVEEIIEGQVSSVLSQEGLSWKLPVIDTDGYLFPPVDFRFGEVPEVLVISPRDRIELMETRLLKPNLGLVDIEEIEIGVEEGGVSALVTGTGAVATYPSVVSNSGSLKSTLRRVAHEWVHHYMIFFPLGRNYWSSDDMITVNETIADVIGNEVGDRVYQIFYADGMDDQDNPSQGGASSNEDTFDFNQEMRITRLTVDELLAEGKVDEAERYMEERRLFLAENGFYLRKLNQAFFAFHGTYADAPTSVSPIGGQVQEVRVESASVKDFMKRVSGVSTYDEFLGLLEAD